MAEVAAAAAHALGMLSMDAAEDPCAGCAQSIVTPPSRSQRKMFVGAPDAWGRAVVYLTEAWCSLHNALHAHTDCVELPPDLVVAVASALGEGGWLGRASRLPAAPVDPSGGWGARLAALVDGTLCCCHAVYVRDGSLVCPRTGTVVERPISNVMGFSNPMERGARDAERHRARTQELVARKPRKAPTMVAAPAPTRRPAMPLAMPLAAGGTLAKVGADGASTAITRGTGSCIPLAEPLPRKRRSKPPPIVPETVAAAAAAAPGTPGAAAVWGGGAFPSTTATTAAAIVSSSSDREVARLRRGRAGVNERRLHKPAEVLRRVEEYVAGVACSTHASVSAPQAMLRAGEQAHERMLAALAEHQNAAFVPLTRILAQYAAETSTNHAAADDRDLAYVSWVASVVMHVGMVVAEAHVGDPTVQCGTCCERFDGLEPWCPTPKGLRLVAGGTMALMANTGLDQLVDLEVAHATGVVGGGSKRKRGKRTASQRDLPPPSDTVTIIPFDPTIAARMAACLSGASRERGAQDSHDRKFFSAGERLVRDSVQRVTARAMAGPPNSNAARCVADLCALPRWYDVRAIDTRARARAGGAVN